MHITVIIATRNRANELKTISLPSLIKQQGAQFDVLVWDSSDTNESECVCGEFAKRFETAGIDFAYVQAPRRGLPSQRNDAIRSAKGDVVFFIDDDAMVGHGCIKVLSDYFDSYPWLMGAAPPPYQCTAEHDNYQ